MKTLFIAYLCLFFVGCKSNKNETTKHKITANNLLYDSVSIDTNKVINDVGNHSFDTIKLNNNKAEIGNWEIHGTEPFWNVKILNNTILFTKLNDNIDTVYFYVNDFVFVDDGISVKLKDEKNKTAILNIIKKSIPITDGMSDKLYNYVARLKYEADELKGVAEKK